MMTKDQLSGLPLLLRFSYAPIIGANGGCMESAEGIEARFYLVAGLLTLSIGVLAFIRKKRGTGLVIGFSGVVCVLVGVAGLTIPVKSPNSPEAEVSDNGAASQQASDDAVPPQKSASEDASKEPAQPKTFTATFSCRTLAISSQVPSPLYYCFRGNNSTGSLKIRDGGDVKMYDVQQYGDIKQTFTLHSDYRLMAQASTSDTSVLRLEITDEAGGRVFADEVSGFGVINAEDGGSS